MQNFAIRKKFVNFEFSKLAKVAQLAESQVVVLVVAGSSPVLRPKSRILYDFFLCLSLYMCIYKFCLSRGRGNPSSICLNRDLKDLMDWRNFFFIPNLIGNPFLQPGFRSLPNSHFDSRFQAPAWERHKIRCFGIIFSIPTGWNVCRKMDGRIQKPWKGEIKTHDLFGYDTFIS